MWKVMIADDENYMLEAMENLIDWKKMECQLVYKARNGQVLLEQIKKNPPPLAEGFVCKNYRTNWQTQKAT